MKTFGQYEKEYRFELEHNTFIQQPGKNDYEALRNKWIFVRWCNDNMVRMSDEKSYEHLLKEAEADPLLVQALMDAGQQQIVSGTSFLPLSVGTYKEYDAEMKSLAKKDANVKRLYDTNKDLLIGMQWLEDNGIRETHTTFDATDLIDGIITEDDRLHDAVSDAYSLVFENQAPRYGQVKGRISYYVTNGQISARLKTEEDGILYKQSYDISLENVKRLEDEILDVLMKNNIDFAHLDISTTDEYVKAVESVMQKDRPLVKKFLEDYMDEYDEELKHNPHLTDTRSSEPDNRAYRLSTIWTYAMWCNDNAVRPYFKEAFDAKLEQVKSFDENLYKTLVSINELQSTNNVTIFPNRFITFADYHELAHRIMDRYVSEHSHEDIEELIANLFFMDNHVLNEVFNIDIGAVYEIIENRDPQLYGVVKKYYDIVLDGYSARYINDRVGTLRFALIGSKIKAVGMLNDEQVVIDVTNEASIEGWNALCMEVENRIVECGYEFRSFEKIYTPELMNRMIELNRNREIK